MYGLFQSLAQDDDSTHLTLGKLHINQGIKKLQVALGLPPQEEERSYLTVTSTNSYSLPERFIKLIELYTIIGTYRYYADPVYNNDEWGIYQRQTSVVSDRLQKVFVRPSLNTFEIYPKASTASLAMTMIYESFTKDLSADDYTTGTITTLANGGTAVVFSGTALTTAMNGRWLKTDDGEWYRIQTVLTATTATLQMPYQGTSIVAGTSAFTISEMPHLPATIHELPVYYALFLHFLGVKRDEKLSADYKGLWENGIKDAKAEFGSRYSSAVISGINHRTRNFKDPNDYPDLSSA
jgi:hypothetical protein